MKQTLFLLLLLFLSYGSIAQLQVFVVEHNGTSSVHTTLDTAVHYAQAGDILYLPGGNVSLNGTLTKGLTIIGAGYHPDSTIATQPTRMFGDFNLQNGADNLFITGIHFMEQLDVRDCQNVTIKRCLLLDNSGLYIQGCDGVLINECVIRRLSGGSTVNTIVSNSIIIDRSSLDHTTYTSNIFLEKPYQNSSNLMVNIDFSTFNNNIIVISSPQSEYSSSNSYYNNIFTDSIYFDSSVLNVSNVTEQPVNTIFQQVSQLPDFSFNDNYHLKTGSPAIGAGIGAVDCGIYGGADPFKEGGLPLNPHIQSISIDPVTDQNGSLNINVQVEAQQR